MWQISYPQQMGQVRVIISQKFFFETCLFAIDVLKNFSPFCSASPEIIGVKVCNRQTDRQTDKFFDTIYGGIWIFSFS